MNRVVVLEGPDGAGKTTLARHLVDKYGFEYLHTGPPGDGNLLLQYASVLDAAVRSHRNTVIDRLHIGESVYGPLLRGVDRIGSTGQLILQRIIRGGGVIEVFCLPPYKTCYGNWFRRRQEKGELVDNSNLFDQIYNRYRVLMESKTFSHAINYDYTKVSLDMAGEILMSELSTRLALPDGCIGDPQGTFFFLGEQANQESLDLPWVALNNSSEYLLDALRDAGFEEREMIFANARTLQHTWNPLEFWINKISAQAGRKESLQLVALGNTAKRSYEWAGFANRSKLVPHPAYWKRFHSTGRDTYVKKLRTIRTDYYARVRSQQ